MKGKGVLALSRKILAAETSQRYGTLDFASVLKESFPNFNWKSSDSLGANALHYFETCPESQVIDLLVYNNIDTNNPNSLSLWTKTDNDPFKVTLEKGLVYGLGASQEKMSVVPLLKTLSEALPLKKNIMFVAGYGRDRNMIGAKTTLKALVHEKSIESIMVTHPTESKISLQSVGRTKMEIFIPFSAAEKKAREEHDLKENISSQSKIFNFRGGDKLEDNVIFKALEACSLLPSNALLLDFSGGANSITEAESVYLELDFVQDLEQSMVSRLEGFANLFSDFNKRLLQKFNICSPTKALHLGKSVISSEGVSIYGFNMIPAGVNLEELKSWFKSFQDAVKAVGGEVRLRDSKKPFFSEGADLQGRGLSFHETGVLNVTEASVFSKCCDKVFIFGLGKEGLSKTRPNEHISLTDLEKACQAYQKIFEVYK